MTNLKTQFEVGKIYVSARDGDMIRITKRIGEYVQFVHLTDDGREYSLDFKRKKVHPDTWFGESEVFTLPVGLTGMSFDSGRTMSDEEYEELVQKTKKKIEDRKDAARKRIQEEADELEQFLKEEKVSYELFIKCADLASRIGSSAFGEVEHRLGIKTE